MPLMRRLGRLILVRHGESLWNITDKALKRETRFTGNSYEKPADNEHMLTLPSEVNLVHVSCCDESMVT